MSISNDCEKDSTITEVEEDSMSLESINKQCRENDNIELSYAELDTQIRGPKRNREDSEEESEWNLVHRKGKKMKDENNKIQVYISSSERLPKQFSLAKLFKECSISDIVGIKYLNPFKLRLDLANELSVNKLDSCQKLIDMGWRIQRPMEQSRSYGVLRDIEIELSEEEIIESLVCPEPAKIISVLRLQRRSASGNGWTPSETVRLCFKGSYLPPYVYVDNMRIKVDKYIFPVSQCSRCWKIGHTVKRCPSQKIICPKCGDNHENCDTKEYKCVNCAGNHMALVKSCPTFLKEKKIRELMAEFNCTYRKALTTYITPDSPSENEPFIKKHLNVPSTIHVKNITIPTQQLFNSPSYAEVIMTSATVHNTSESKNISFLQTGKINQRRKSQDFMGPTEYMDKEKKKKSTNNNQERRDYGVSFSELLVRLKEIIFLRCDSIQSKIRDCLKCCLEWLILVVTDNISDWPVLKQILDYFNG